MAEDWLTWLLMAGRGGGKTRVGAEATHRMAEKVPRMHLIAPTGPDFRETIVEGESGILATAPPDKMPEWEPSRKKLTWPNGAIALGFSGEEPDRLRGPQCYWAWIDEPAAMPAIGGEFGVWDNLLFGLRLGKRPWVCATTTPKPTKWMKELVKDPMTRLSRFSTYSNLDNLAPAFRRFILDKYEGTRVGRQELEAELIEKVEGALWDQAWFRYIDAAEVPDLDRIIVSVDPAGTANKHSDETGIVVLGVAGQTIYVLADYTGKYSPAQWATVASGAYATWSADAIIAEKNYGGDMVREVLEKNGAKDIRIELVTSRRGKVIRAEPIAALYEKFHVDEHPRVIHVRGLKELEDELTTWVQGKASPNRLDALVHGATKLARIYVPAQVATPTTSGFAPVLASAVAR